MIMLVDTSVWIDFFNGTNNVLVDRLEKALREEDSIRTCGIILMEIFQGFRSETEDQGTDYGIDNMVSPELRHSRNQSGLTALGVSKWMKQFCCSALR